MHMMFDIGGALTSFKSSPLIIGFLSQQVDMRRCTSDPCFAAGEVLYFVKVRYIASQWLGTSTSSKVRYFHYCERFF